MSQHFDPKAEIHFPEWVDATALAAFKECEKKGFYSTILRLTPTEINPHFNAGGAYAKAQETIRNLYYKDNYNIDEAIALGVLDLIKSYGDYDPPADAKPSISSKTWMGMADAVIRYYQRFPPELDWLMPDIYLSVDPQTHETSKVVSNEFSFAVPIGDFRHPETGNPIIYSGRADMRVRVGNSGVWIQYQKGDINLESLPLYIFDDKTTYQMSSQWAAQWAYRSQFLGYTWANNIVLEPDSPDRVHGAVVSGAAIQKTQTKTERAMVMFVQWQIDDWYDTTCYTIERMLKCWHDNKWRKAWDSACTSYGGCDWQQLCLTPNPTPWLRNYYVSEWNPVPQKEE